jgi:tripartite-type tricarboxylate transporter receptor subunit TctC
MIKKLLLTGLFVISPVWAQTVVSIVWPFAAGSTQANYIRAIAEDANLRQNKYTFVFDHRPGAGGSVAMKYVLNSQKLTVVSNGTSLFLRPIFFPGESYDVEKFSPVLVQSTGQPLALASKKYYSVADLKKQKIVSIGMINGSITELIARTLAKQLPGIELIYVPYQGTPDIIRDVIAGNIDVGIDFAADLQTWLDDKKINVLGITGQKSRIGFPTLSSQGYKDFENIVNNQFFLMPALVDESVRQELHEILRVANRSQKVIDLYQKDFATPSDFDFKQSNQLFVLFSNYWPKLFTK